MIKLISKIPAMIDGETIERYENCRICNKKIGKKIAEIDYWNIKTSRLIKCPTCNHIQLDPMLNESETSKGCYAYYIKESMETSKDEQIKNCVRNFRRGVVFGYSLKKKKIFPHFVLELGPGSGYFAVGLQFVFPDIEITVMDINQEVLNFNQEHHQYKTILNIPDKLNNAYSGKFDLVIARDIIEHVSDISNVLKNVNNYLKPNGLFHFLTPNGHEDIWQYYLTSKLTTSNAELLINHVNFFDGKGLKDALIKNGFKPIDYFTYTFKTTLHGKGWKINEKLMSPISTKTNADSLINEKANEVAKINFNKKNILDKWYIKKNAKWITYFYSIYQHYSFIKINPEFNVGHEIYGLFQKE